MAHGDGGCRDADVISSPVVSLGESCIFKGGIRVLAPIDGPTTTFFEFRNRSSKWVVFRLKCTHPSHFNAKPRSVGLIAPKESLELRLVLQTNYDSHANYQLLIETLFVPAYQIQDRMGKREVMTIWSEANKADVSTTRFPIFVRNLTDGKIPIEAYVYFDEPPSSTLPPVTTGDDHRTVQQVPKDNNRTTQQCTTFFDTLLQNEKFFTNGLDLLLVLSHCFFMYFSIAAAYQSFL